MHITAYFTTKVEIKSTTNFHLEQKPSHHVPAKKKKKKNAQWIHTIHALALHLVPIPSVKSLHT